jgi:acetyl/propionyl-CoA carboxylase alpha subunit/acetyl-CoA carboxylase carboxyltransferase component
VRKLLIANRAEIAIRIARTAAELGIPTVGVHAEDDDRCLHVRAVDDVRALPGRGPAAYLDVDAVVAAAVDAGCDALHPGYGFLSERAELATACAAAGITFVGPSPETLARFGDKTRARADAEAAGVPVGRGTSGPTTLDEARAFLAEVGAVMVKAVAGGGGRGMRPVHDTADLDEAYARCSSEAASAFGNGDLYVEELLAHARHVEVQLLGDGQDVVHLGDRECSLQRHRQKVVELAPASAVDLPEPVRAQLLEAAVRLGRAVGYRGLGTIELLVAADGSRFVFLEVNPRLQVEHTVTEAVTGLDLVGLQLQIADGDTLADLGLATQADVPAPVGIALQARVNLVGAGTLTTYEAPSGPGVRVDGHGYAGYATSTRYDALLAKVVVHARSGGLDAALAKARRALSEFRIEGVPTNLDALQGLLADPAVAQGAWDTTTADALAASGPPVAPRRFFEGATTGESPATARAGVKLDSDDPLAVLVHGKTGDRRGGADDDGDPAAGPEGSRPVRAPLQGTVIDVSVAAGDEVVAGQPLAVMEAMKMEHVVVADVDGVVRAVLAAVGDTILEGHPVAFVEPADVGAAAHAVEEEVDLDEIRPDLAEVLERHRLVTDEARPDAVERRRRHGQRTARENVEDLVDDGSFVEYSPLTVAARRRRNTMDELIAQTPTDGLIMGLASVNGDLFPGDDSRTRCAVMAYDYTVLAGTQGANNHVKLDRMAELALRWRLPTVFFTEGGGGRPGDTEGGGGFIRGFEYWGKLSGAVPLVGVTSGRCFAGNAAILGCCDVIIATKDSALGMGGPAMVEGGGLGVFRPEEIGPVPVMQANGTIDVLVDDEAHAVRVAKQYLSYFQGPVAEWSCADQRLLRRAIPENRVRAYDVRRVIELLADDGSVLELRPKFGLAMITALARVEGRPIGIIANNPQHLGGAIDSDASDKAARFLQLCEAFDVPVLSLSDTPGNMVGPEAEKTGLIRHCSRLFVIGANLTVPIFSVILRKSYGLGAIAMTGGSYQASMFCVSWPTGEFGGMGLEGSVKLGYRNELAAIEDPVERKATFDRMVAAAYAAGKAVVRASGTALDDVIDPADTRRWILAGLRSLPAVPVRTAKKVPWIDAW